MDVRALLLAAMMFSMLVTFIALFIKLKSFRVAFLATMIVGTKWTLLISLFGYDKPLYRFYLVNRANPAVVKPVSITVCQVIGMIYIFFIVLSITWPWIIQSLPREVRKEIRRIWEVEG